MKRIIVLLCLVLPVSISFSQAQPKSEPAGHLTFQGVPIDGSLSAFVSRMEKNGFSKVDFETGYALLVGNFASYKNCMVAVETLEKEDVVSKIAVMFMAQGTWSVLSSDYFSLKEMLTKEYGAPAAQVEKFKGAQPADDIAKMNAVKSNNSDYYTTYETPKGSIQLSIEHDRAQKCFVQLAYYDKINGEGL